MADRREPILAQLLVIMQAITPGTGRCGRNLDDMSAAAAPGSVVLDGDETIRESESATPPRSSRGDPRILTDYIVMTPSIQVVVSASSADVGTVLNSLRAQIIPAVINDSVLRTLVTSNGELRYTGLTMETQAGERREGRMTVDFRLVYPFNVSDL